MSDDLPEFCDDNTNINNISPGKRRVVPLRPIIIESPDLTDDERFQERQRAKIEQQGNIPSDFIELLRVSPLNIRPIIDYHMSLTDIVGQLKDRCFSYALRQLDNLDPTTRLNKLLDVASEFCNENIGKIQEVLVKIQETKAELVQEAIDLLATPFEKVAALNDMLVDALNTKAYDMVEIINGKLQQYNNVIRQFENLGIKNLDGAIDYLNGQMRQFADVRDWLSLEESYDLYKIISGQRTEIGEIQDQFQQFRTQLNNILGQIESYSKLPDSIIDLVQNEINKYLDLRNIDAVNDILNELKNAENTLLSNIQKYSPQAILSNIETWINDALQEADFAKYYRILDEAAAKLCNEESGFLPTL